MFSKAIIDFLLFAYWECCIEFFVLLLRRLLSVTTGDDNCGSHEHERLHLRLSWTLDSFSGRVSRGGGCVCASQSLEEEFTKLGFSEWEKSNQGTRIAFLKNLENFRKGKIIPE